MAVNAMASPAQHAAAPAAPATRHRDRAADHAGPVSAAAPVADATADEIVVGTGSPPVPVTDEAQPASGGTAAPGDDTTAKPAETGTTGDGQTGALPNDGSVASPPSDGAGGTGSGSGTGTDTNPTPPVDSTAPPAEH